MRTASLSPVFEQSGPFATALLDVSQDSEHARQEHQLRLRGIRESLTEQGADAPVVAAVSERLEETVHQPAPVSRVVVATRDGVLLDETVSARADQPVATWGPLPDLGAWIAHQDAARHFVLVMVDHTGGSVAVYDSEAASPEEETTIEGETEFLHRVPSGGWSAPRYQRVTKNVWTANAEQVAEEALAQVRAGHHLVLLAGEPQSRPRVLERLADSPAVVVELESGSRAEDGGDEALREEVREALTQQVAQRRLELAHRLQERLGRDQGAVAGADEVADAFVRGQVDTLLIDPAAAAQFTLEPSRHPGLAVGPVQPEGPVRADQALIAAAVLTGAEVSVSSQTALGGSPAAALLRWDQEAVGSSG